MVRCLLIGRLPGPKESRPLLSGRPPFPPRCKTTSSQASGWSHHQYAWTGSRWEFCWFLTLAIIISLGFTYLLNLSVCLDSGNIWEQKQGVFLLLFVCFFSSKGFKGRWFKPGQEHCIRVAVFFFKLEGMYHQCHVEMSCRIQQSF